jgi:sulfopyruvate decarboxylase alpha subunit
MSAPSSWHDDLYAELRRGNVEFVYTVPDEAIAPLLHKAERDPAVRVVTLTTEEEGVAASCGAWLGGKRAVLMMQSSGVGNCINAFSLVANCRFPLLLFVAMRGEFAEVNPWQAAMGRITADCLRLAGFEVWWARSRAEIAELVSGGIRMCFGTDKAIAILLSQRLVGAKEI